jgi:DNA-binding transcriptional MerR regulator
MMTQGLLDDLRSGIAALAPSETKMSKRQHINIMIKEIDGALERGVTLEQIKAYLDGKGFELSLNTLRQYIAEARKADDDKAQKDAIKPKRGRKKRSESDESQQAVVKTSIATTSTEKRRGNAVPSGQEVSDNRHDSGGTDQSRFVQVDDKDL